MEERSKAVSWRFAKLCILISSILVFSPMLSAQVPNAWQPVPKEDLALKDNPSNPGSSAMILERRIYTDDEKRFQTEFVRIKILTDEGRANADIEIPYRARITSVSDIQARTVEPDGSVIDFDGIVFDKVLVKHKRLRYDVKAFTLPAVGVGSIIEYAYTIRWKETLPDYVRHPSQYTFEEGWTVPTTVWTVQQDMFTRHVTFVLRPVKGGRLNWSMVGFADRPQFESDGTVRMEMSNVPSIEHEESMLPESALTSRVHFYYLVGSFYDYWEEYGKIREKMSQKLIGKSKSLESVAEVIAPRTEPPETRLRALYARVQKIRHLDLEPLKTDKEIAREHLEANKSAEDILHHGYGYGNEINFLFTSLARASGFEASIVEVVDRNTGIFQSQVLDSSQLNAMVVLVVLDGKNLYLDPATPFCPYGDLPWYENETYGVRWDKTRGQVLLVESTPKDTHTIERNAELKLQPDGGLEGTLDILFDGQDAVDLRLEAMDEDGAGRHNLLEEEIKKWLPTGATLEIDSVDGWENPEQPLYVKCRMHASRFAVLTPRRMLFPTGIFQINRKAPLSHRNRTQALYFRHGYSEVDKISIILPSGYRVEALPGEAKEDRGYANFDEKRASESGVVHLERRSQMNQFYFQRSYVPELWQYFQNMRASDGDNVVLHAETALAD